MVFYFSERAFAEFSGEHKIMSKVTKGKSLGLKIRGQQLDRQTSRETEQRETEVERVDRWLKALHPSRSVARDTWSAVAPTQLMDIRIDLECGAMPFMWLPHTAYGENRLQGPIRALWAEGTQPHHTEIADATASLVLIGSFDNMPGRPYSYAQSDGLAHSHPSDPHGLSRVVIDELSLDADADTVEAATGFERSEARPGDLALWAWEQSKRGREPRTGVEGRQSWVLDRRPEQRVVAAVTDVSPAGSHPHIVLARPLLIDATI